MWFGILTPGEHECRPVAHPGTATLYCWNDIARMRIDGPADDLASGLRMLRGTMRRRGQEAHDPRCFVCGTDYALPDPQEARAAAEDLVPDPAGPDGGRGAFEPAAAGAIFALVHLEDDIREVRDEEALVVIPGARLATLVALDAIGRMLEILGVVMAGAEPERCSCCDAIAPAGARSASGTARAGHRVPSRAGRVGLSHARPAPRNRRRRRVR